MGDSVTANNTNRTSSVSHVTSYRVTQVASRCPEYKSFNPCIYTTRTQKRFNLTQLFCVLSCTQRIPGTDLCPVRVTLSVSCVSVSVNPSKWCHKLKRQLSFHKTIKIYKYRQNTTKFIILYHFWTTCFDSLESSSGPLLN